MFHRNHHTIWETSSKLTIQTLHGWVVAVDSVLRETETFLTLLLFINFLSEVKGHLTLSVLVGELCS